MADVSKIQLPSGDTYDIVDSKSGYIKGMTILSYGNSTWQDFINAYSSNKVVYCRASSNSNPASGSQTRLAFMAYVDNATTPTNVEFQYYRSVSTHTASQQGDQVYVYKLTNAGAWSVTVREASVKVKTTNATGTKEVVVSYSSGAITIGHPDSYTSSLTQAVYPITISPYGHIASYGNAITIPTKVSDLTNDSGFITASEVEDGYLSLTGGTVTGGTTFQDTVTLDYFYSSHAYDNGYYIIRQGWGGEDPLFIGYNKNGVSYGIEVGSSSTSILGLRTPVSNDDAATKKYVDDSVGALTIPTITLNGSSTTSPSFYAPTSAGTSGYYLKSNGSGAPTWAALPSGGVSDVTVGGTSVVSGGVAAVPAIPEDKVVIAEYGVDTYSNLIDAIENNKTVICKISAEESINPANNDIYLSLIMDVTSNSIVFSNSMTLGPNTNGFELWVAAINSNSEWHFTNNEIYNDLSGGYVYATSQSAASSEDKTAMTGSIVEDNLFALVIVKFHYGNTANSINLRLDSGSYKPVYYRSVQTSSSNKLTWDAEDVVIFMELEDKFAYVTTMPTNISAFNNDAGYITTETDPTVPSWAKASTKPSYTYTEVGAAAASHSHGYVGSGGTVSSESAIENGDKLVIIDSGDNNKIAKSTLTFDRSSASTKHNYLSAWGTWESIPVTDVTVGGTSVVSSGVAAVPVIPTKVSDLTNDSGFVTTDEKLQVGNISNNTSYNFVCMTTVGAIPRTSTALLTDELQIKKDTTNSVTNLLVGNDQRGQIKLSCKIGGNHYTTTLTTSHTNTSRTITLPDATGTVALTSDITDEKVKTNPVSNDTVYYPIVGSNTSSAATKYYDASGLKYSYISSSKTAALMIGNETNISSNGKKGILRLGGSTQFKGVIDPGAPTADRTYTLPDASGTIALTSDISGKVDKICTYTDIDDTSGTQTIFNGLEDDGEELWNRLYLNHTAQWTDNNTDYTNDNHIELEGGRILMRSARMQSNNDSVYSETFMNIMPTEVVLTHMDSDGRTGSIGLEQLNNDFYAFADVNKLKIGGSYQYTFDLNTLTANRTLTLPNASGTVALTSDIPTVTDEKLKVIGYGNPSADQHYPILTTSTNSAETKYRYDEFRLDILQSSGGGGIVGLNIGSNTGTSSLGYEGRITLYGQTNNTYATIKPSVTAARDLTLPDKSGTIALTSDIPTISKNVWYGTSSSTTSTDPKIVTTNSGDFELAEGNIIYIQFTTGASGALGNLASQINVDNTGAKNIYTKSGSSGVAWSTGATIGFIYNGSNFIAIDKMQATLYFPGETILNNSVSSTSSSTAATPSAVKQAYDLADSKAQVQIVRW